MSLYAKPPKPQITLPAIYKPIIQIMTKDLTIDDAIALARSIALEGGIVPDHILYRLADITDPAHRAALYEAAEAVTSARRPRKFDSCSIVNARSGRCSENCKWCAQSAHYNTGCDTYDFVDEREALEVANVLASNGVGRYSAVASGKAVKGRALDEVINLLTTVRRTENIVTCASLGLLNHDELKRLWDSGTHRYHCNMETAPSYFPTLCSTHSQADKMATINAAREIGFEICSGGIIGMGESARQRVEFAIFLREVDPVSIPINILAPITGTPLENTPLISDEEILDTIAIFRLAHPDKDLRFAGGRKRLDRDTQLKCMRIGINGAIVGDLLTTLGSTIAEDKKMVEEAGYVF